MGQQTEQQAFDIARDCTKAHAIATAHQIVILTGAGLSAESGLSTFRHPEGIWSRYDYKDVATPEGFAKDPDLVHEFYNHRRAALKTVKPNAAHHALAHLEAAYPGHVLIVTQNVDHLHEAAGSKNVIHMHGQLLKALCTHCHKSHDWKEDMSTRSKCPSCGKKAAIRPDVVWFGEQPYAIDKIGQALLNCTLFFSIGTSGNVYPAANFVQVARNAGARTIELNVEATQQASLFDEKMIGPATTVVPLFIEGLIRSDGQRTKVHT